MYCQHCGAPLENGAVFCSACGKRVREENDAPKTEPNTEQKANSNTDSQSFGKTEGQTYGAGSYYQGNPNGQNAQNPNGGQTSGGFSDAFREFQNTEDTTGAYEKGDISAHTGLSILAYFGPLVLIPICVAKNSPFARFHCNQGLILLIADIIYTVVRRMILLFFGDFWIWGTLLRAGFAIVGVLILVLCIIGVINAAGGKAKELPLIGKIKLLV